MAGGGGVVPQDWHSSRRNGSLRFGDFWPKAVSPLCTQNQSKRTLNGSPFEDAKLCERGFNYLIASVHHKMIFDRVTTIRIAHSNRCIFRNT